MELFSEIYSNYYLAVERILGEALHRPLTRAQLEDIVGRTAFAESGLFIVPRLAGGEWPLLSPTDDGRFSAVTAVPVELPLTTAQRAWLAVMLNDRRCAAFLTEAERSDILAALSPVTPLYDGDALLVPDVSTDGDSYSEAGYAERLRIILDAIRDQRPLCVTFTSASGQPRMHDYLPCRLEYSEKDDKLRLLAIMLRGCRVLMPCTINLGRVTAIAPSREVCSAPVDYDALLRANGMEQSVCFELTDERNALERVMLQFACYRKRVEYDEQRDRYYCELYFDQQDETELLIRILSFGPVLCVTGPEGFLAKVRERVQRQAELLK